MTGCHYNNDSLSPCFVSEENIFYEIKHALQGSSDAKIKMGGRLMPTERFYRLPAEKKRIICNAAVKEFARVPIDKVSINQIIKEAEISRGSFYTYFEDKWDLLACIFEESQKRLQEFCRESMIATEGNIWIMLEQLLDRTLEYCSGKEQFDFIKSIMNHAGSEEILRGFSQKINKDCDHRNGELEHWIYEKTDKRLMGAGDYKEFHCFFQLAMFNIAMEVKDYFEEVPVETIKERFAIKMEILKHGICRKGSEGRAGES